MDRSKNPNNEREPFPFINSSGPAPEDPAVRKLIRKQAMKNIGLNRRKGHPSRANPRQSIANEGIKKQLLESKASSDSSTSPEADSDSSQAEDSSQTSTESSSDFDHLNPGRSLVPYTQSRRRLPQHRMAWRVPFQISAAADSYEHVKSLYGIEITHLSGLTNWNVSKSTIPILATIRDSFATVLRHQQWSFLEHVPSRYSYSPCLAAATDCLLARANSTLRHGSESEDKILRLYSKALKSLQNAIADTDSCNNPDILCAIHILSLCELLEPSRETPWSRHIYGAKLLVQLRTADNFQDEYDKALFAAHVGPAISEAMVTKTPSYLDQPQWTQLYRSIVVDQEYLTERSALIVDLRILMFSIPNLWLDFNTAIISDDIFDETAMARLEQRCELLEHSVLDWLEQYKAHCVRTSFTAPEPRELALRREAFGTAMECLLFSKRLLSTLNDSKRLLLELEVQALARLTLELQDQPGSLYCWLFRGHEHGVVMSVMATRNLYEEDVRYDSLKDQRLASRKRYLQWAELLNFAENEGAIDMSGLKATTPGCLEVDLTAGLKTTN